MGGVGRLLVSHQDKYTQKNPQSSPYPNQPPSCFIMAWNVTLSVLHAQGPVVGGFLARPASKYPLLQIPFFCEFPYLLPCLVGGVLSVLSLLGKFLNRDTNYRVMLTYIHTVA